MFNTVSVTRFQGNVAIADFDGTIHGWDQCHPHHGILGGPRDLAAHHGMALLRGGPAGFALRAEFVRHNHGRRALCAFSGRGHSLSHHSSLDDYCRNDMKRLTTAEVSSIRITVWWGVSPGSVRELAVSPGRLSDRYPRRSVR